MVEETPTFGRTLFHQVARHLAAAIEAGEYDVDAPLPTEAEIARQHGVSRHTVRDALAELRALGLVTSRQGSRSIVSRRHPSSAYVETYSSIEELIHSAHGTPIHPQHIEDVVADSALAGQLRGQLGQAYLKMTGIRRSQENANAEAIGHVEVHIDAIYAGVRAEMPTLRTSVAEALYKLYGLRVARIEQEITASLLPDDVAAALDTAPGSPALSIMRWYFGDNGRIFEIALSRYPIGRFAYRNSLSRRSK